MTDDQPLDSLRERGQQLPRSLQPGSHLWDRIEAELVDPAVSEMAPQMVTEGTQVSQPARYVWPIAALTLLGVAIATLVFRSTPSQPQLVQAQPAAQIQAQIQTQMRTQMVELLDAQLDDLPGEVRATVIENLEIIALAREEIRLALEQNPDSSLLHSLYLNSYANERTLLKDVEAMARQSKRRINL